MNMILKKKIRNFWEELGTSKPSGELATHRDNDQVALEIDTILQILHEDDYLLDIGCGTGFSTSVYAKTCKKALGLDYAEAMIESAKKRYQSDNLKFEQQDILSLDDRYGQFSMIVTTRCLINLTSWNEQKDAIKRIHNCLKPGGTLILAEGTKQGREALNVLRISVGLRALPTVWHNIDFDEELLIPFLADMFDIKKDIRFGLYDVLTRIYYPLTIAPDEPQYGTPFHRAARRMLKSLDNDPFLRYSREFVLVMKRHT